MLTTNHLAQTAAVAALCVSALLGTAATALADPPNCTAADLAGVAAGVSAATSAYLFTHPDVNGYITSLGGLPKDQRNADLQQYLDANPQTEAELQAIRQPLTDLQDRCSGNS